MARHALPNLTVQQLDYLVAVADAPTWAAAAASVGVTPSALSQGLAELERRVGVRLFDVEGRRRVLVPAAAPVLAHAREVVARTADLARYSERLRQGRDGALRVGMVDAAAVEHFPEALRSFRAERPGLHLHLTVTNSGALLEQLRDAVLDLVVCVEPPAPVADVTTSVLTAEPLHVHAPTAAALAGAPATWGPWVTFPADSHSRVVIEAAARRLGAPFEVVAESHQPEVLREMVRLGLGWTVLPLARFGDGDVDVGPALVERTLVVARRADAVPLPAADALVDALRAAVAERQA